VALGIVLKERIEEQKMRLQDIHPDVEVMPELLRAAEKYEKLQNDYIAGNERYRRRLYAFNADCYEIAITLIEDDLAYQAFLEDPFWETVRQKPKHDDQIKAVLTFTMKPKSEGLLNRIVKTAAVLQELYKNHVAVDQVAVRLESGGGIEKIYRKRHNSPRFQSTWDDVEYFGEIEPTSKPVASRSGADGNDDNLFTDDDDLSDDDGLLDGPLTTIKIGAAADNEDDNQGNASKTGVAGGKAKKPQSLRGHVDLKRDLAMDFSACKTPLSAVFRMKKIQIEAIVTDPEGDGWRQVVATKVVELPSDQ
jgi:hypothetical protein